MKLIAPEFQPDVPEPLLREATPQERWMYETLSVQRQQNHYIIERLAAGDERFDKADTERLRIRQDFRDAIGAMDEKLTRLHGRVVVIERIKERLSARWAVLIFLGSAILGPLVMAFIGAVLMRWIEKIWK